MKVLHLGKFFPPDRGGMETHLALLAAGLKRSVDVEVAVATKSERAGRETIGGIRVHRMRTLGVVASTPICPELLTIVRDSRPDIVHIHHPHPLAMLGYLIARSRAACVVTYQSDVIRQRWLNHLAGPVVRATLRRSAAVLVTSPRYLETSAVLLPFRSKCHVVPLGIDTSARMSVDRRAVAELRQRYGPRIVLAVGRLTPYKGFDHLIRAMAAVDASLLIVGAGPLHGKLDRLIARMNLRGRVHLLGQVSEVLPYYEACEVFVLPSVSRNEAFGLVQLEAMTAGKPVVNTSIDSGVTFACPTDVAALTVPPADASALARAINRLLDDPALRDALGAAGRARVQAEFSAAAMVRRTLEIYRSVSRVPAGNAA